MTEHVLDTTGGLANVSRRALLAGAGVFVLAVGLPTAVPAQEKKFGADGMPNGWRDDPAVFIAIGEDGTVTVTCHRSEMGQGVRTSIAMVVADELEADWARVRVAQAWGDEERFGNQDTDGSRSLRHWFMPMRRAGAAARTMLEQAAAAQWGVPASEVRAARPCRRARRRAGAASATARLAKAAAALPVPDRGTVRLKDASAFRYIGKDAIGLVDNLDITTGQAVYGIDARAEGMLHAVVARPPVYGGKVASYDATEALKVRRRRQGDRHRSACHPVRIRAARRRRRDRPQHLGGDQGARGAEDYLGRRPERGLFLRHLSRAA